MSPAKWPSPSTSSSFSTFARCRMRSASSSDVSGGAVTRPPLVITLSTRRPSSSCHFRSRRVRMPSSFGEASPGSSTIGTPLTLYSRMSLRAVPIVAVGGSVTGSAITPFSLRLTFSTSNACASADRFLWMMPMPPSCASAMASADSVTVSIGALKSGTLSVMRFVSRVCVSASPGVKSLRRGNSSTSSNVMASATIFANGSKPAASPLFVERRVEAGTESESPMSCAISATGGASRTTRALQRDHRGSCVATRRGSAHFARGRAARSNPLCVA